MKRKKKKLPAKKKRVTSFKKPVKKKTPKKKFNFRKGKKLNTLYKRTKKDWWGTKTIHDIYFSGKKKSEIETIGYIWDAVGNNFNNLKDKNIKLTFIAKDKKNITGLSYNFLISGKEGLLDAISIMIDEIFNQPIKKSTQDYMKRIIKLKGHIIKMEIVFK